MILNAIVQ